MKRTYRDEQTRLEDDSTESVPEYAHIQSRLSHLTDIFPFVIDETLAFSMSFVEAFLNDRPNYEISEGIFGATRSNWTYHTAMAIAQTCKMLNLTCKFEALGKRDAVIETRDEKPETILVAEWEWDYEDIFGRGKELDKLKTSCKASKTAEAFLLIYCPISKYLDHLQRIAEYWIGSVKKHKRPPSLFLHTIIFKEKTGYRELDRLITVEINPSGIFVWNGRYF
jgi:hypothetical protein